MLVLLVISPSMTYKTGRMSVRPCVRPFVRAVSTVSKPKSPRLLGRRQWNLARIGPANKLLGSGILNFGPCVAHDHSRTWPGRDKWPPPCGLLIYLIFLACITACIVLHWCVVKWWWWLGCPKRNSWKDSAYFVQMWFKLTLIVAEI